MMILIHQTTIIGFYSVFGYPVQARELTTLQSILQNQIERFGQHFFKEGAKVIPGNTAYNRNYYAVELNTTFQGVPIDAYIDQLVGLKITGTKLLALRQLLMDFWFHRNRKEEIQQFM